MNKDARQNFWEYQAGSRLLEVGSLVCLAVGENLEVNEASVNASRTVLFATVADRKGDSRLFEENRCMVTLSLVNDQTTQRAAKWMSLQAASDNNPDQSKKLENVMLQIRGHFYIGYEPVLRTLQSHSATTIPFLKVLTGENLEAENETINSLPPYINHNTRYDLSLLYKRPQDHRRLIVPIQSFEQLRLHLSNIQEDLILDATQIDAFASALTRRISLIQGPPGTGKTYVGIQIVRALLKNSTGHYDESWKREGYRVTPPDPFPESPAISPILCICYTNHALDQFLEGLIRSGIPIEKVIRVGGRSKSETLAKRALHELSFRQRNREEQHQWLKLKIEAQKIEETILQYSDQKAKKKINLKKLQSWIQFEYPDFAEQLFGEDDSDQGFQTVGKVDKLLAEWLGVERSSVLAIESVEPQLPAFLLENDDLDLDDLELEERQMLWSFWKAQCLKEDEEE